MNRDQYLQKRLWLCGVPVAVRNLPAVDEVGGDAVAVQLPLFVDLASEAVVARERQDCPGVSVAGR